MWYETEVQKGVSGLLLFLNNAAIERPGVVPLFAKFRTLHHRGRNP
jgi:hypothetical protein